MLALLPGLFSAYVVGSTLWIDFCYRMLLVYPSQTVCSVAWLLYVASFVFLLVQWVRFVLGRRVTPSVRGLWAASAGYFGVTIAGIVAFEGYLIWLSFQPEPLLFNDVELRPLELLFIPGIAIFIPILCFSFSIMLLRRANE